MSDQTSTCYQCGSYFDRDEQVCRRCGFVQTAVPVPDASAKLKAEAATLTARCEALEAEKAQLSGILHDPEIYVEYCDELMVKRATDAELRCEALTAERDNLHRMWTQQTRVIEDLQRQGTQLNSRCQHLERAVDAADLLMGRFIESKLPASEWSEWRKAHHAALASLLPAQEETPGTDENRVSFAAGYTTALDDALKGKA